MLSENLSWSALVHCLLFVDPFLDCTPSFRALPLSSWMFNTFTVKAIILLAFSTALRRPGLSSQKPNGVSC